MPDVAWHLKRRYADLRLRLLALQNDFDPDEALLIFSDPRGGSTWLAELIQEVPRTAMIWEPLHLDYTDAFRMLGFQWRQYIPDEAEWEEARRTFERLLRGRLLNGKLYDIDALDRLREANRPIVKFCRGTALLPWLTRQFAFRHKPVYLVRHPFAVAASQLRFGAWDKAFRGFAIPREGFNRAWVEPHADFLRSIQTKEEALVATWCLSNLVPLRHPANSQRWITIFYEDMLIEPERELERVFGEWGMPVPPLALDRVRAASATTKEATFQISVEAQLQKWKTQLSASQIERMERVLTYFEVEEYDRGVMPLSAP